MNSHHVTSTSIPVLPVTQQPLVYAQLAANTYYPSQDNDLPKDFTIYFECPEELRWWGYFGKTYFKVNENNQTINFIISHRGTDNLFGLIEDTELWLDQILPTQYREGALPFMQLAIQLFKDYAAQYYPNYEIIYEVTGHSLGAGLAENTLIDSANGILPSMKGVLFENPGLPNSSRQKPRTSAVKDFLTENTVLINTQPDAINTLYPTDSQYQFNLKINNAEYPRLADLPLPICPSWLYYAYPYSFWVTHPISKIVNFLQVHDTTSLIPTVEWPYGFENGFEQYKNYAVNQTYWDGYIYQLWHCNGLESDVIQILFDGSYNDFSDLFKYTFLNNTGLSTVSIKQDKSAVAVWEKLSQENKAKFNHDQSQFIPWLTQFYLRFSMLEYPLLESLQTTVDKTILHLLEKPHHYDAQADEAQTKFKALIYIKENTCLARSANCPYDEPTVIKQIFYMVKLKFNLTPYQMFDSVPEALSEIDFRYLDMPVQPVVTMPKHEIAYAPMLKQPSINHAMTDAHVTALLRFLKKCLKHIPTHSAKYQQLDSIAKEVHEQRYRIDLIKDKIQAVKEIVSVHRDTDGLKGFFNLFRNPTSLNKFNEIFDEHFNLIDRSPILKNAGKIHPRF